MIYTGKFGRIEIYRNTGGKTPEEIQTATGCTTILNGVLFNADGSLCLDAKINGQWVSNEDGDFQGLAWSGSDTPVWTDSKGAASYDNFITSCPIGADVRRGRTAIGFMGDTYTVLCVSDAAGALTWYQAYDEIAQHCDVSLVVDGGGSAYCCCPGGTVDTSVARKKQNQTYLLIWEAEAAKEVTTMTHGIDVSEHQGAIDWDKVKSQIDYAIIRAGYGKGNIDKQFQRNLAECERLGIPVGVYWFSYALSPEMAKAEADYCLAAIKGHKITHPICWDYEYDSVNYSQKCGVTPTPALVQAMAKAFLDKIEAAGCFAANYANPDYINRYFGGALHKRYALWLASWPDAVDPAKPPQGCMMWQWGKRTYDGIDGVVDSDYCYHEFVKPQEAAPVTPAPAEEPWYAAAQKWAVENKIADGTRADQAATRAEVWAMLYQAENNKK